MATTGMATEFVENLLRAVPEEKSWAVGEALAECVLADDDGREICWPWNLVRDRRTPRASLPGADLVGFCKEGDTVLLLFGEVKTSSDANTPPNVMNGSGGMAWQLKDEATRLDIQHALLKWLRARCDSSEHRALYQAAVQRYVLMAQYHLAKAAEILGAYLGQGSVDGHFDIREQLEAQFDRAIGASARGQLIERETMSRLLARAARVMVDNSIWTVTRAVNSRVTRFVESLTARHRRRPIFEMLPPQRRTLREEGLLGSGHRSVVVSLLTSSGKTFIAEFRILQALNQFDQENGWVAYLAPTRALVNQLASRLRRDFAHLGTAVEKVSPALEVDGLEAGMLTEADRAQQFRILVTTPEKLDLMLRGGWEEKIGRPLTLVVVDEAHGLASENRGLKLELLLATINRECRYAQFLLLTPFIRNGAEIARWLSPDSNKSIDLGVDWTPNDRVVAIARVDRGDGRGEFSLSLHTRHTTRNTLDIPEQIGIGDSRPLGLAWSAVANSPGKIAATTAQVLQKRGTVIVLADTPAATWGIADAFKVGENKRSLDSDDLGHVQRFLVDEMGQDFPLASLLEYGVGVHHAGTQPPGSCVLRRQLSPRSPIAFVHSLTLAARSADWGHLFEIAAAQDGLFTTRQAAAAGYSPQLIAHHLGAGRMVRVRRGVYRLVHFPAGDHEDLTVVWLWSDQEGVFSHQTALALHDLSDVLPAQVHLTLPETWRTRRLRVPDGVILHYADVAESERRWFGPVPATAPLRTLEDCAAEHLPPELLRGAALDALARGLVARRELVAVEAALAPFGGLER